MQNFFMSKVGYKNQADLVDWLYCHPNLIIIRDYWAEWCYQNKTPALVTSIIRPQIQGISKSRTHEQGRAFDASVYGWSTDEIDSLCADVNKEFSASIGGISSFDLKPRACIYHFGTGPHFHFQVRP